VCGFIVRSVRPGLLLNNAVGFRSPALDAMQIGSSRE
jgi:hypothetical protein